MIKEDGFEPLAVEMAREVLDLYKDSQELVKMTQDRDYWKEKYTELMGGGVGRTYQSLENILIVG